MNAVAGKSGAGASGEPGPPSRSPLRRALDGVGAFVHEVHGSRGLLLAGTLVLVLTVTERLLPGGLVPWLTGLALALLLVGVLTLPREAAAAQQRLAATADDAGLARVAGRLLVLPILLVLLLLPRLFLAAYGIPHLTPAAGLVLPTVVRRVGLVFLAAVLLVPVLAFRQARHRLGPGPVPRPRDLADDLEDDRREVLLVGLALVGGAWLLLLRSFWSPFSVFDWPPRLASLAGSRGVTALAFALVVPAVLCAGLALDGELFRTVRALPPSARRSRLLALVGLHVALALLALYLHAYDLLWVANYQAASG